MLFELPTKLNIGGTDYAIRSDYRAVLEICTALSDSELSDEEKANVVTDENCLLTMTILNSEGKENVYRFYKLTSRKAYITINGNGGFYVLTDRVEKFVSDAQRFFAGELIDATAKK